MAIVEFTNNQAPYINAENLNNNFKYTIPVGAINLFAGVVVPNGWLMCDGSEISRNEYSELFNIIGTNYGAGNGETTFNLPNLKGRVPVGLDDEDTDFENLGNSGGEKSHTLTINEMPSHNHAVLGVNDGAGTTDLSGNYPLKIYQDTKSNWDANPVENSGGGQAHNILQPYLVMNYIIKC